MQSENAASRINFVSDIYQEGEKLRKQEVLNSLPKKYMNLHKEGEIHIHDLEAFGKVYNCCTPNFNFSIDSNLSDHGKIMAIFESYKSLITNLGVCQSGGIGFANFDDEISQIMEKLSIPTSIQNIEFFNECIKQFILWINTSYTRYCREPYYLTFNIGLSISHWGRIVIFSLLTNIESMDIKFTRPNVVFKVHNESGSIVNENLFKKALSCTAKRMIPTYLLTDSDTNKNCDPKKLGIMGCRSRVYQNINGEETVMGRGNLGYVSINLPRIALESKDENQFFHFLLSKMLISSEILKIRIKKFEENAMIDYVLNNNIWNNTHSVQDMIKQGTLSIGFIGLSETVEILTGKKMHEDDSAWKLGQSIIKRMRDVIDTLREKEKLNYSLLATPGEMISGKFCECDANKYHHPTSKKGFYTNSFHVEVDSKVSIFEKIEKEGPFHSLCNGGSISYVEFREAPLNNLDSLLDAINYSQNNGISYLGFNFPLDVCLDCGYEGTYDSCPNCKSTNIKRIRRVSGYLEDLTFFTKGKKAEVSFRKSNLD